MLFHQRFIPCLAIASYIVGDEQTGEAAVIDPTRDVEDFLHYAREHSLHIRHIMETHVHADFVSGAHELQQRLQDGAEIYASGLGGAEWTPPYTTQVVQDGDAITLGTIRLQAIHTPGHTPSWCAGRCMTSHVARLSVLGDLPPWDTSDAFIRH